MIAEDDLEAAFEAVNEEYLKFERIPLEERPSSRSDLCAFLKIDTLVPGTEDIVSCAVHDMFYLGVDLAALAAVVTEADIVYLVRCGVSCNGESLTMFT